MRKDDEIYEGYLEKGKYHGNGVFKHKDKEEYRGEFKNGEYEGVGKYSWDDGNQINIFVIHEKSVQVHQN